MNTEEVGQKLLQARMALEEVKERMGKPREEFLALLKQFLAGWFDATVRAAIRAHSTRVLRLGRRGMHVMKEEYNRLLQRVPEIVEATFSSKEYWPHLRKPVTQTDKEPEKPQELEDLLSLISDGVQEVQGQLGALLIKHGFTSPEDPEGDWGVDTEDRESHLRFKHDFTFTKEMNAVLEKYGALDQQLTSLRREIQQLEAQREDEAAEDVWEQA